MKSSLVRAGRLAALFTMAVTTAVLVAPGAEASVRGVINTPNNGPQLVWAVPAAGYPYHSTQSVPNGTGVHILCQTLGEHIVGTHGDSNVWDFLTNAGMVPHTNVDYGNPWIERIPGVPACQHTTNPTSHPNPKSYHGAIDRAYYLYVRGDTSFEGRCLAFVAEAYGWDAAGWRTAEIAGTYMKDHGLLRTEGTPPRGALVWYHNSSGTGHVMLSIGHGYLIGTSVDNQVGRVLGVNYRSGYRGWSDPYFPSGSGPAPSPPWPEQP
jgi:hypothetical protein